MDSLPALLQSVAATADRLWADSAARCADGELACRPGCTACCTGLFAIGAAEAFLVRSAVDALPAREREMVRGAAEGIRRSTAAVFPGDPESGLIEREPDRFVAATHAIPCPLLDNGGRCRIYAARPLTCRTSGLALVADGRVETAACLLNFGGDEDARAVETGLSLPAVRRIERDADTAVVAAGWDPSAETTIAHAIVGSAFRS